MSTHGIDVFNFEFWQGPPPAIPQQHVIAHNRAGANGVALQRMGRWGDPFEVITTSHWASSLAATAGYSLMNAVVGTGWLAVKYANLNYTGLHGTGYHATMVEQVDLRVAAILMGPGYSYTNGGVLVTRWTLHPELL